LNEKNNAKTRRLYLKKEMARKTTIKIFVRMWKILKIIEKQALALFKLRHNELLPPF